MSGSSSGATVAQQAPVAEEREADRGPRAPSAAASRSRRRRAPRAARARGIDAHRRAVAGSTVSSKRAASCTRAQRAQRVLAEGRRIHRAQERGGRGRRGRRRDRGRPPRTGSNITALIVKSRRRAASSTRQVRIADHRDPAMSGARLGIAARQRDVHRAVRSLEAAHLEDGEGLADRVHAADAGEGLLELREGKAEDLDVEVLGARRPRSASRTAPPTR